MRGSTKPLDPFDELLKRELDRVHLILTDPLSYQSFLFLLRDIESGRIKPSLATRRRVERVMKRKMAYKVRGRVGGRKKKGGRPRKKRKYVRRNRENEVNDGSEQSERNPSVDSGH